MSGGAENEASGDVASVSGDPKIVALVNCMASSSESDEVIIQGCDFIVRGNGGSTHPTTAQTGKGNLIVGWNEGDGVDKTGLNNLVVGSDHTYTSTGGVVFGEKSTISAASATVTGGYQNTASALCASVSGGYDNTASSIDASVSGGETNTASGQTSSVTGGYNNIASGDWASVSGGRFNEASGDQASVTGGSSNNATDYENLP